MPSILSTNGTVVLTSGSLSGTVTVYDAGTRVAEIDARGNPPQDGTPFDAGQDNGWTLDVTWDPNGSAGGYVYNGSNLTANVPVVVDMQGKPRRRKNSKGLLIPLGRGGAKPPRRAAPKRTVARKPATRRK